MIEQVRIGLFVGGHCLITGLPGTAKTLLVRTMAETLGLMFKRIQFTPDLMPTDITGTDIIEEDPTTGHRTWTFVQGPLFANVLLADEINRTPPKTQSALLEAMQERACTVRGHHYLLPAPFFVLATQNPIELEGTYPLPEAQLDRFLFNIILDYLSAEQELKVVDLTTTTHVAKAEPITTAEELLDFQQLVRMTPIGETVAKYAIDLVQRHAAKDPSAPMLSRSMCRYGGSVQSKAQFLVLGAQSQSVMKGRYHVSFEDVRELFIPILRHRILLNFHAESDRLTSDDVLKQILQLKPAPKGEVGAFACHFSATDQCRSSTEPTNPADTGLYSMYRFILRARRPSAPNGQSSSGQSGCAESWHCGGLAASDPSTTFIDKARPDVGNNSR